MELNYEDLRYRIIPTVFVPVFTLVAQVLVKIGNPEAPFVLVSLGTLFAWKVVIAFYAWAYLSLTVRTNIL